MNTIPKKINRYAIVLAGLILCTFLFISKADAQTAASNDADTKAMSAAMSNSANEWNKGDLKDFVAIYTPQSTMMMPGGPVGIDSIKSLYQNKYFKGKIPKQKLKYTDIKVRYLGKDYALLTGGFTLYGNNLPERSGRYSLVMIRTKGGWKILHDHSS